MAVEAGYLSGDTNIVECNWDAHERLTQVTDCAVFGGSLSEIVKYLYDAENRWVGENIDGDGVIDHETRLAYDGNQIVLQFDKDISNATGSASSLTASDLSHRYLWQANAVDQLMADERTSFSNNAVVTDEVLWA